jgi:hypothetical protein
LPLAIAMMMFGILKSAPVFVLIMYVPLLALLVVFALQLIQLWEYGRDYERKIPWYVYVQTLATQLPYQYVLSFSAARAVVRHCRGMTNWQSPARSGDVVAATIPVAEI